MGNTKALEAADAAARELVNSGLIDETEEAVFAQSIEFAFADLRTQLTQANTVIAERDAQLADSKLEIKLLRSILEQNGMKVSGVTIRRPNVYALIPTYSEAEATRQPTQDKGGE